MKKQMTFVLLLAAAPLAWSGQAPGGAEAGLQACAGISEGVARLDCFDRLARAHRPQATSAPPVLTPAPAAAIPPAASPRREATAVADTTAFAEEQLKAKDLPNRAAAQASLQARIASTRKGTGGVYFVTLDNGQVWRHEEGAMAEYLRDGEAVTISRASLGSYRLTLDSQSAKNWIRVARVR